MTGVTFVYVDHRHADTRSGDDSQPSTSDLPSGAAKASCARYTQASLKVTLQAAGCKPWVAHKVSIVAHYLGSASRSYYL